MARWHDTSWLKEARKYLGETEIKGRRDNPVIVALWELGKAGNFDDDETPWCAAFVSAVLEESGIRSARTGWARAYRRWGKDQKYPAVGSVVVFSRGPKFGHVGFVVGRTRGGNLAVLGGNQSNQVNVKSFSRDRVLDYRWPTGVTQPDVDSFFDLPLVRLRDENLSNYEQ